MPKIVKKIIVLFFLLKKVSKTFNFEIIVIFLCCNTLNLKVCLLRKAGECVSVGVAQKKSNANVSLDTVSRMICYAVKDICMFKVKYQLDFEYHR